MYVPPNFHDETKAITNMYIGLGSIVEGIRGDGSFDAVAGFNSGACLAMLAPSFLGGRCRQPLNQRLFTNRMLYLIGIPRRPTKRACKGLFTALSFALCYSVSYLTHPDFSHFMSHRFRHQALHTVGMSGR